jgi:tetratricopeptide (TPR) repeat protein
VLRIATGRLARLDILQGRPAVAARRLEPLDDRFEIEEMGVTENLPVLAWAYLEMGEVERAVETAAAAVSRAREQEVNLHLAEALLSQGRVLHRQGKLDEARTALAEALELARAMPYPHLEARSLVASAELERSHGDGAATDRQLAEALAIFQRIGARRDVERAEVAATQR